MAVGVPIGLLLLLASAATSVPGTHAATARALAAQSIEHTRSVWDGVYTEAQARRGQPVFQRHCGDCHQESEFGGGYASLYQFFDSRDSMPQNTPGSLTAKAYADLTAYVLKANGFPAGDEELGTERAILEAIRFGPKPARATPD